MGSAGTWDTLVKNGMNRGAKKRAPVTRTNLFGQAVDPHAAMAGLKREFTFPPFTVFNARDGLWQARKRKWLALGIESELGRGEELELGGEGRYDKDGYDRRKSGFMGGGAAREMNLYSSGSKSGKNGKPYNPKEAEFIQDSKLKDLDHYRHQEGTKKYKTKKANAFNTTDYAKNPDIQKMSGVSIFDPVLCELSYRWYCPPGGHILDPFSGGSVRGVVASCLGFNYTGIDLSARQIASNREQGDRICTDPLPTWIVGDSVKVKKLVPEGYQADLIFSCPPYFDLEVYSHDPSDISNMSYEDFLTAYRKIILRCVSLLRNDRFAVWVVGEVRNKKKPGSPYVGLVQDTITAFRDAGAEYYNEGILITSVGSLPVRTRNQFNAGRKLGRTHQTILTFVKGDPSEATRAINQTVRADQTE